jgi:hypothetical protein
LSRIEVRLKCRGSNHQSREPTTGVCSAVTERRGAHPPHRSQAPIEQTAAAYIGRIDDEELKQQVSISYTMVVPPDSTLVSKPAQARTS